ncbi:hypothetical protein LTR09_006498 [Extremus antarcticus]|uniref:Ysc84 actin-binding domain-containing protein n=1 Tax=Extremus antarcticus TaxID=702011 RepID=A0AAJ0DE57_9PEZI|nr:hypothetical protein LTR09_006498 [Extremus antarcticus]
MVASLEVRQEQSHWFEDASSKGVTLAESKDSNEQFYGAWGLSNKQILTGDLKPPSGPVSQLSEVLKAIESGNHESGKLPASGQNPGVYALEAPKRDGQ